MTGRWRSAHDIFAEQLAFELEKDDGRRGPYVDVPGNPFGDERFPCEALGCDVVKSTEHGIRCHVAKAHRQTAQKRSRHETPEARAARLKRTSELYKERYRQEREAG